MEAILGITDFKIIHPIWWVVFAWFIWILFRWRNWPRPSVSIMLLYSASIAISYIRFHQVFQVLMKNPLFDPVLPVPYYLLPFLAAVCFWLTILYIPVALSLRPRKLFGQQRYWWISFLVLSLGAWHVLSTEPYFIVRALVDQFRDFTYSDLISTNLYFYPVMGLLIPLLVWLLLGVNERSRSAPSTLILYLISLANVSTMLWFESEVCNVASNRCAVNFSLPLFMGKIALWFIPLYALIRLVSRIELGKKNFGLLEELKDQPIGVDS